MADRLAFEVRRTKLTMIRVSSRMLPGVPRKCHVKGTCVYRDANGVCDDPRINKGNGDSRCHRMNNRDVVAALLPYADFAGYCERVGALLVMESGYTDAIVASTIADDAKELRANFDAGKPVEAALHNIIMRDNALPL